MQIAKTNEGESATIQNSGLDFTVKGVPLYFKDDEGDERRCQNHQLMMREDEQRPFGVVGSGYVPIQNSQLWDGLQNALYDVDHTIVNAGTLDHGAKVFIQAQIEDEQFKINGNDLFRGLITFWASHDGSTSLQLADTFERIWCKNTFNSSMAGRHNFKLKVKHTKNAEIRFENMIQSLDEIFDHRRKLFDKIQKLSEIPMRNARPFTVGMLKSSKTRGINIADEITRLMHRGIGNQGETRYDMLNGFTEYYTHGSRKNPTPKQANNLLKSSELGAGARMKVKVLEHLSNPTKFEQTVWLGNKLLDEYESVKI